MSCSSVPSRSIGQKKNQVFYKQKSGIYYSLWYLLFPMDR